MIATALVADNIGGGMPDSSGPIRGVRLTNFRRFTDTGRIRLAPITLVLGKNSSGKTSLLRSLLLAKQLVSGQTFRDVSLAGPYVDFGSYRELVFGGELTRDVSIELTIVPGSSERFPMQLVDKEVSSMSSGLVLDMTLHWNKRLGRPQFAEIRFEGLDTGFQIKFERRGPESFIVESPFGRKTVPFSLSFANLMRLPLEWGSPSRRTRGPNGRSDYSLYYLLDMVADCLRGIQHIGPLRDMPDRAYRIDQLSPDSPTASVVNVLERQKRAQGLMSAALREMGMARDVSLANLAPGYVGIVLTDPTTGRVDNLTDVGFGVSQALPVIAELATAAPQATLLVEQPELHLHPDAQGRFADVLIRLLGSSGAYAIIETHSEHLLLRMLRRAAEGQVSPSDVSVVVVDNGEVQTLGVDELGRLTGGALPPGFFEEDWEDTMLLARAAASKASDR